MDTLDLYREKIKEALMDYSQDSRPSSDVEIETIVDTHNDHYQLMTVGWCGEQRIHGTILHLDIRGGKIWIQHDGTEEGIAYRLVAAGVPKSDIVLGFQSPFKRQFTEFAVG